MPQKILSFEQAGHLKLSVWFFPATSELLKLSYRNFPLHDLRQTRITLPFGGISAHCPKAGYRLFVTIEHFDSEFSSCCP